VKWCHLTTLTDKRVRVVFLFTWSTWRFDLQSPTGASVLFYQRRMEDAGYVWISLGSTTMEETSEERSEVVSPHNPYRQKG
jgi:hypothetical protein